MNEGVTRIGLDEESDASLTDWGRVVRLSDEQIEAAVAGDDDAYMLADNVGGRVGASYRYHVYCSAGGDWRWRLVDAGGQVLAVGAQGFATRDAAEHAVEWVRDVLLGAHSNAA